MRLCFYILEIALHVFAGRLGGNAFKYPVKICDAVESAVIGHGGDAVIIPVRQLFTGFVDTDFVEEGNKGMEGMFLKIPAESLWRHVCLFGHIFQGDRLVILLHDIIIDGADPDPFMFAVGARLGTGRERLQFLE